MNDDLGKAPEPPKKELTPEEQAKERQLDGEYAECFMGYN